MSVAFLFGHWLDFYQMVFASLITGSCADESV